MAKYKYDVYEIADYYSTKTISGTERTEIFRKYTRQVSVYKFYSSTGNFSYYGNVNVENSEGYYYVLNNDYYKITEGFFSAGGSQGHGYLKLIKIQITKGKTRGDLIESIVAEENEYPEDGIKDGKWYVRKEIIQEHKISLKDSEGELINISSIYFKDNKSNILNIAKAYSDKKLVWEKSNSKQSEKLIITKEKGSYYSFTCNSWREIIPNKKYRITTDKPGSQYVISVNNKDYPIKNNDIFTLRSACDFKIVNTNYSYFTLKIYETEEEANITI